MLEYSEELRQKFVQEMTVYNRDMFVIVDETESDRRDTLCRYGYSLKGKLLVGERGFQQLEHSTWCHFCTFLA